MTPPPLAAEVGPAIVSAAAALAGVCLAQAIAWRQRRSDERRRRRSEIAGVIAPTLSLISEAIEQIKLGDVSETAWQRQPSWHHLREKEWPPLRTLLLAQAALEPSDSAPSFDDFVLRLQDLLGREDTDAAVNLAAWQEAREAAIALRDARLPRE